MATSSTTTPVQESNQQQTHRICQQRVSEHLATLRQLDREIEGNPSDERRDEIDNELNPLALDSSIAIKITLSWGGPSDGYTLTYTSQGERLHAEYWYADWFTYAETPLSPEDFDLVERLYLRADPVGYFPDLQ